MYQNKILFININKSFKSINYDLWSEEEKREEEKL